jgi:PKHD-type hydroxylase
MSKLHNSYFSIPYKERPLNKIKILRNSLNDKEINKFVESLKNKKLEDGLIGSKSMEHSVKKDVRMCKVFWVPKTEEYMWLYKKVIDIAIDVNRNCWDFDLVGADIPLQYVEYDSEYRGHYDWHLDIGNTNNSKRKLSVSIQLSDGDDYDGGNLLFFNGGGQTRANRDKGSMILFPSYILHKVEPVKRGKRKALILWLTGPPFR